MSEEVKKHPLNVKGKYYVDQDSCLYHCCFDIAPENFKVDEDTYCAYVVKQPENPEEESQCIEAMKCCPMQAIYDDGE